MTAIVIEQDIVVIGLNTDLDSGATKLSKFSETVPIDSIGTCFYDDSDGTTTFRFRIEGLFGATDFIDLFLGSAVYQLAWANGVKKRLEFVGERVVCQKRIGR